MANETVKLRESVERGTKAVKCPCGGYAGEVDVTPEEDAEFGCGGAVGCCSAAFVCAICGNRLVGGVEAPDMDSF
jgi:hypothetical protein